MLEDPDLDPAVRVLNGTQHMPEEVQAEATERAAAQQRLVARYSEAGLQPNEAWAA